MLVTEPTFAGTHIPHTNIALGHIVPESSYQSIQQDHRPRTAIMRSVAFIGTVGALVRSSSAILAVQGSPCDTSCGNVLSSTGQSDVVCNQAGYGSSAGVIFSGCTTCQLSSTYYSPSNETDLTTMLCT